MKDETTQSLSPKRAIRNGAIAAFAAWGLMLLLFGVVAGRWLIAGLAGFCCGLGMFLCFFARSYLKAVEKTYQAQKQEEASNEKNEE